MKNKAKEREIAMRKQAEKMRQIREEQDKALQDEIDQMKRSQEIKKKA